MTADLSTLRAVLEGEVERGCTDQFVDGGLDQLLRLQARGEQPPSPLLRMVAALPAEGYRSLDVEERRRWARRAIATIVHAQAETRGARATARRPGRPAGNKQSASPPAKKGARAPAAARKIPPGPAALDLPIREAGTGLRDAGLKRLEKLGIHTVGDALRYYPYRHNDFSLTVPITQLRIGQEQTVRGTVDRAREVRMGRGGRMRSTEVSLSDQSGASIRIVWFNQPYLARQFRPGMELAVSGMVRAFRGHPTFDNPEFEAPSADTEGETGGTHTGRLVPVYHLTQGLPQRSLRSTIQKLIERFADRLVDPLPAELRRRHGLLRLVEATRQVHYPDSREQVEAASRRLAFDELLAVQLSVVSRKRAREEAGNAARIEAQDASEAFLATLPYALTGAQQRALADVLGDLARPVPMARLLEGDVGSGKTVVALAAMLGAVASGYQATMMAPTEVLAEQHFRTICTLLSGEPEPPLNGLVSLPFLPLPLRVVLLTGSTRTKERRDALDAIRHGGAQIVVGTHALIQQGVQFQRLGLSVVDEQHRFGVMQRSALREKGEGEDATGGDGDDDDDGEHEERAGALAPHMLVMTATPIPRSLALTLYGDLDISVIDEMPPGRTPIETRWLPPERREEAFATVREEVEAGRQAFVICPLVEGSEAVLSRAATEEYERLRTEQFPDLAERIALLHGRMSAKAKDGVMTAFAAGESAILVSTAVVEVGIDIPNATVMVIEGADRFGMAQLHQFRGRVGRGEHASTCYLLADDPSPEAEERLSTVARTRDGFALAQADLELRGPGELFGTRQSGVPSLRIASLLDTRLIETTRAEAESLLDGDPALASPALRPLREYAAKLSEDVVAEMH